MIEDHTFVIFWSEEDGEYVAVCDGHPFLSWLAPTHQEAWDGIRRLVEEVEEDMRND